MDQLNYWDRNAPISRDPEPVIEWKDARSTVIEAYYRFSPRMAEIADGFFGKSWIDAPVREGKSPGAFSHPTVPSAHPYIMMNYLGKPRDVMTLAHELGHGVHQVLANAQGALMAYTPLTLAETASVFGEMLTFKALLNQTQNPRERRRCSRKRSRTRSTPLSVRSRSISSNGWCIRRAAKASSRRTNSGNSGFRCRAKA